MIEIYVPGGFGCLLICFNLRSECLVIFVFLFDFLLIPKVLWSVSEILVVEAWSLNV